MAAREWFFKDKIPPEIDRDVLNRAGRLLADRRPRPLSFEELCVLRQVYRPGLSAREILEAAENALNNDAKDSN